MQLVVAMHRRCSLCHSTALPIISRTRRMVHWAATIHRLHIEEVVRSIPLEAPMTLRASAVPLVGSTTRHRGDTHATVDARIRHNAQLSASPLTITLVQDPHRQHRRKHPTALRVSPQT